MTFWNIGDEECKDRPSSPTLQRRACITTGSWLMNGAIPHRPLPAEWFVPDWWVASIPRGKQLAAYLVQSGKWKKVEAGYQYTEIQASNTPEAIQKIRDRERDKKRRQREAK